jgi:putative FmdB family regulatory protein
VWSIFIEPFNAMPIYAYKCDSCGHAKDVLQKISDDPLSVCPQCGAASFTKQVTAAGFQLKGSGWYATDFKGGSAASVPAADKEPSPAGNASDTAAPAAPAASAPAAAAPTPAAASAAKAD